MAALLAPLLAQQVQPFNVPAWTELISFFILDLKSLQLMHSALRLCLRPCHCSENPQFEPRSQAAKSGSKAIISAQPWGSVLLLTWWRVCSLAAEVDLFSHRTWWPCFHSCLPPVHICQGYSPNDCLGLEYVPPKDFFSFLIRQFKCKIMVALASIINRDLGYF